MTIHDVAIVGCGPVGALAANLLAGQGLSVLVIDLERTAHPDPRAVHLDHEMMRLFQWAGLATTMRDGMRETEGHLHVGADHGVIRYMGTAGRPKPFGWANDYFFYQPELEEKLRHGLSRFEGVEPLFGYALTALDETDDHVVLRLDGDAGARTERARWVIGCDGARSTVRRLLGIALEDLDFEEPWLVVDAEVEGNVRFPDLWGVPAGADLQQLSVMMCDPARPATIVPGRGNVRRWEFMMLPGEPEGAIAAPDSVARLLAPYVGGVPHRILRAATYRFHGLIAAEWRRGRVFLAGDAAHQTPPFFGQGMCHGMRDAANLAWKLALVERGVADQSLLDTYRTERDPHVRSVVSAAIAAGRYICELDRDKAAERDAAMRARATVGDTAADLIPAYAAGAIAAGSTGAGERFVQPWITTDDGPGLLDDVVGVGWRLFVLAEDDGDRATAARARLAGLDVQVVPVSTLEDDGTLARWFEERSARVALVRPDSYVFGAAPSPEPLVEAARRALSLRETCPRRGADAFSKGATSWPS